ncbi:DUF4124 domain-containing protein [Pseudomonas typographi]|uniref:DUF4124 domain-containing protein n=1 Tax=Pseudomonas typographi TaxID=2715964 RepID=A0ABR7Z6F7_9PSED|nr:DUF4124 domain-containing protein [Pseudomonas typographi]MBD1601017.1 DUF4124 domain-containing protein [Pseudomonas typographi]
MRLKPLIASIVLAAGTYASAAQIYKWVDAQGVTHFDAQPPAGQNAQPVQINAPQPASPPGDSDGEPAPKPDNQQRAVDASVRQQVQQQQQQTDDYCQQARTNLAQLNNNPRVRMEVDGEMRRLTEEERQKQIATTQQGIDDNCKN